MLLMTSTIAKSKRYNNNFIFLSSHFFQTNLIYELKLLFCYFSILIYFVVFSIQRIITFKEITKTAYCYFIYLHNGFIRVSECRIINYFFLFSILFFISLVEIWLNLIPLSSLIYFQTLVINWLYNLIRKSESINTV